MKPFLFFLLSCIIVLIQCQLMQNHQESTNGTGKVAPGLSMSLDLKLIEQFKDTHLSSLIR